MTVKKLPSAFIIHAAEVLADTNKGLSASQIARYCNGYALDFGVDTPVTDTDYGDFGSKIPNKRTALKMNLDAFSGNQQFIIIKELCELPAFKDNEDAQKLKSTLLSRYSEFSISPIFIDKFEETGWEKVDRALAEMNEQLSKANTEVQFNAIGVIGRQTIILIAREVFNPTIHNNKTEDGDDISNADAKRMLDSYLDYELCGNEKPRKWAKATVDLSNQLTHDFSATKRHATMCIVSVTSLASMIKAIVESKK